MKKEREYQVSIVAGMLLLFFGSLYYFSGLAKNVIALVFINAGIILVVIQTIRLNRFGAGVVQDERTVKVSNIGISYSWLTTFVFLNILFWIDSLQIINMGLNIGVTLAIFVMIVSAVIFKSIFKNREL